MRTRRFSKVARMVSTSSRLPERAAAAAACETAAAFELWTGQTAPTEMLRERLDGARDIETDRPVTADEAAAEAVAEE